MSNKKFILTLDSSQIRSYMTCPHMWYLSYVKNLRAPWKYQNASDIGTLTHQLLEIYYTLRGLNPNENAMAHANLALDIFKQCKIYETYKVSKEDVNLIANRFVQYNIKYMANDIKPLVRHGIVGTEVGFTKKLYEDGFVIYLVEGRMDLLARIDDIKIVVDNKTQAQHKTLYSHRPQVMTYLWATGYNYFLYNYFGVQKTYVEGETLWRDLVYVQPWQIERWVETMLRVFDEIRQIYLGNEILGTDATEYNFNQNLNSCSGPDEKRACQYAMRCNAPIELHKAIDQTYFYKAPKWSAW